MQIPIIDFAAAPPQTLAAQIDSALADSGFMALRNLGIEAELVGEVFATAREFFHADRAFKERFAYRSAAENFGYQGIGDEFLDPDAGADLKESLTLRNVFAAGLGAERWPSAEFQTRMTRFYSACLEGAHRLLRVLARALDVDEEFFVRCHRGENVTLRLLHYPASGAEISDPAQMGAGAHTDYGMLTLLFQDDVGGLEIRDPAGAWHPVAPVPGAIIVNAGDLLERWSNDRYRSTWHRVRPRIGGRERFSVAFFVDPDSATEVTVLPGCVDAANPPRHPPVTAGEHLQQRIRHSHEAAAAARQGA
jgi:isopenicillin N synthase-like dioxygenase